MENGKWKIENGKWKMGNGEWGMGNGEWGTLLSHRDGDWPNPCSRKRWFEFGLANLQRCRGSLSRVAIGIFGLQVRPPPFSAYVLWMAENKNSSLATSCLLSFSMG
jgi:hypothetical protein